jgi:ABC-type glutathione transport system ATPase component
MTRERPAMMAVRGLKKYFGPSDRPVRAVDDVSFEIRKAKRSAWSANPARARARSDAAC